MLLSMTGHGAASQSRDGISVTIDVRTVNSRYLKVSLRTGDGYLALEPRVDEAVRQRVRRGTVQVQLQLTRNSEADDFAIDPVVLESYQGQLRQLGHDASLDVLLMLPGVVVEKVAERRDADTDWPLISQALSEALERLDEMRTREGQAMVRDLQANVEQIRTELAAISERAPGVSEAYRQRLTERLNKLLAEEGQAVQDGDIVREVGLFAERTDISEEIVRLRSHLDQFDAFVASDDSNGRKLDFLVQEMFRETNTIGSKANDTQISTSVVEIKACIERMREMIQNIE